MQAQDASPAHSHRHTVQFYSDDQALVSTVAVFLGEGMVAGQPAVVVATEVHRTGILRELSARLIDVPRACHLGDLVLMDAEEMLAAFMHGDVPDPECFKRHVGDVIEQALGGRTRTPARVYGEMVDLLWKQGRSDAAIRLEILWNELALTHPFSLLCGYSMGNFFKQAEQFLQICQLHTDAITPETTAVPFERRRIPRPV